MSSDQLPDRLPDQDTKLTSFERERLTIAEYLLRPLLSKLKLALMAMPPTHPYYENASKCEVIIFLDEYFSKTEIPFTDNKASLDKQYEAVMDIMRKMDCRIELLKSVRKSVRLRTTSEASAAFRQDLNKAIGWWELAFPETQEADRDPELRHGLDQTPENE